MISATEIKKYDDYLKDEVSEDCAFAMYFQRDLVAIFNSEKALQAAMFGSLYDWDKIEIINIFE